MTETRNASPDTLGGGCGPVAWRWRYDPEATWCYGADRPKDTTRSRRSVGGEPTEIEPLYAAPSPKGKTDGEAAFKLVMAELWKDEQYSGVGPDYDNYRIGARHDMGGRVERYEKKARTILATLSNPAQALPDGEVS